MKIKLGTVMLHALTRKVIQSADPEIKEGDTVVVPAEVPHAKVIIGTTTYIIIKASDVYAVFT